MKKKTYKKQKQKVIIYNEISMVMMSPLFGLGDPEASIVRKMNPLKW